MNQSGLARAVHISRQYMSVIESGKRTPGTELLATIARVLSVSSDYLLGLKDEDEEERLAPAR